MTPTNEHSVCLTSELLALLAHDGVVEAELAQVESHLDSCVPCRERLESAFSDAQWNELLLPALLAMPPLPGGPDGEGQELEKPDLQSLLGLLGPTDDPRKLGRIANYEVTGIIGRGGMGVVFKAYDAALSRFVAIKMLLPHLAASGDARQRFAREGKAAAAVIDDNVLPIYSVAEWKGVPYLVTQYSRGTTLQKRIEQNGPLDIRETLRIGMQTARGLAAAHAQGLVHRDVKPSNILLDGTVERALLTDFGLARSVDDASITRTGMIAGTPQYMSPEQARAGNVDARSDLFGLGCVLYAMCTGRPPFQAENSYAVLRLITDAEPDPIQQVAPEVPEWLCRIIARLMAKSPHDRFESAMEVAGLLESCLAHVQQPHSTPLPAPLRSAASSRTGGRSIRGLIAMIMLMAGFVGLLLAVLAVLRLNSATLSIESPADNVAVKVLQGDQVVRRLIVSKNGARLAVAPGDYTIELEADGEAQGLAVTKDVVTLSRGGAAAISLIRARPGNDAVHPSMPPALDQQSRELLERITEDTVLYVTDVRADNQVLSFTLHHRGQPPAENCHVIIQFCCERLFLSPGGGMERPAATVIRPQSPTLTGVDFPWIPLSSVDPSGHRVALVFPDNETATDAARQLSGIGERSLLIEQLRANLASGRQKNDGIIHGEHPSIGKYTTEFSMVFGQKPDAMPHVAGSQGQHADQGDWHMFYVVTSSTPQFAERYQLSPTQIQEIQRLQDEFMRTATPRTRDLIVRDTQAAIQNVLTLDQDSRLRRELWVCSNVEKFRNPRVLSELNASDEQRRSIADSWFRMSQRVAAAAPGTVNGPAERQQVFDEIQAILTPEQRAKFLTDLQDPGFLPIQLPGGVSSGRDQRPMDGVNQ